MDILVNEGISTLVIGHNKNWKDKINIGKVNNPNFMAVVKRMNFKQLDDFFVERKYPKKQKICCN